MYEYHDLDAALTEMDAILSAPVSTGAGLRMQRIDARFRDRYAEHARWAAGLLSRRDQAAYVAATEETWTRYLATRDRWTAWVSGAVA